MSDAVEKANAVHSTHTLGPHCMSKEVICTYARRGRLRGQCFILKGALVPQNIAALLCSVQNRNRREARLA
jgi:hypothetical protein